jgi:hypothetical protein
LISSFTRVELVSAVEMDRRIITMINLKGMALLYNRLH